MDIPRWGLIVAFGLTAVLVCKGAFAQTRIMPLGDSITEAAVGHASYRYWLWHDLVDEGFDVDFVGSMCGVHGGMPLYPDFDQDHEGHWGWRADQVLERIKGWASASRPDIVMIHLGHNDIWRGSDIESTVQDLDGIIEILREVNPAIVVLLAQVIPSTAPQLADLEILNGAIESLAESVDTPTSPVIVVDQSTGFDAERETYDGTHPNDAGERRIASRWFGALAKREIRLRRRSITER
jgi:hypothetical protein